MTDAPAPWQPIHTAPEDMRPVYVLVPGWQMGSFKEPDATHIAVLKNDRYCLRDDADVMVEPSHWMPLD